MQQIYPQFKHLAPIHFEGRLVERRFAVSAGHSKPSRIRTSDCDEPLSSLNFGSDQVLLQSAAVLSKGQSTDVTKDVSSEKSSPPVSVESPKKSIWQRLGLILTLAGSGALGQAIYQTPPHNPPVVAQSVIPESMQERFFDGTLVTGVEEKYPLFRDSKFNIFYSLRSLDRNLLSQWGYHQYSVVLTGKLLPETSTIPETPLVSKSSTSSSFKLRQNQETFESTSGVSGAVSAGLVGKSAASSIPSNATVTIQKFSVSKILPEAVANNFPISKLPQETRKNGTLISDEVNKKWYLLEEDTGLRFELLDITPEKLSEWFRPQVKVLLKGRITQKNDSILQGVPLEITQILPKY
ncbi:MAG: hypothetical protein K2X66_06695 [Cyanobacteria bacterium]|nr:hypothetical protein [Cyanobacteriota bacterium]